ncbi:Protein mlp1 [Friedmanniomyces endolithicus]|nr:Protein mlp1 [Friedmanniomyces endolithicus]
MRTRRQTSVVDLPFLSTTFDVSEVELQALLDAPTTELVKDFLASLTSKGQEFDALKADKLRVDVDLESTVRTADTKARAQKAQVTKHVKEAEELRSKLNAADSARESLASELEELRSSTSDSTAETSALRQRINALESSNRDALALVESKSTEKDRVATELSEQHGKLLGLRREINQLEERHQTLENAASSQKFKEQSLQQEIELLKRNNEWHSNELQTRSTEHAKFRKERNARIASLQRELDDSNASVETLKRTEKTLRQRLDEVQGKADEAFARIASLQEEAVRKEQDFRAELDATKRLADLQAQNASTHKARLRDVQGQVEQLKEEAGDEIGRLQAEIETERGDKEQAEQRVAELELAVERFEQAPRPGTPMRNGRLDIHTPSRLGSRAGSPSAMSGSLRKTINGLSYTELYSHWTDVQQALENEKRRTKKLSDAMDELVVEMENRAPEMLETQQEIARLEQEVLSISGMLDEANCHRDDSSKAVQHWHNEAAAAARESDILRQQLRDLSAQMKILLVDIQSRDQGLDEMSAQERRELERAARGELTDGDLERMTDTGRFIAERLVIFRDVSDLQEKNQQMLRLVETLGDQLEGAEAQEKERQTAAYASENEEMKAKVQRLQDELQSTVAQIDSYMKERDMFRRMLQHRGQVPAVDGDFQAMFGQSVPPATPSRNNGGMEPPTPRSQDVQVLNKLLKEQQTFFDQYRNETATDRRTLKEQVDALAREKSNLQADVARLHSQLELAGGRYEMLQGNLTATRNENQELQKRSQQMSEQAARQDLRTQQVAEELVESRSLAESLRNEGANAKAEKELWKRIEARMMEDNRSLVDERGRLNKLVTDLQNLQNERELADSESRRRLQGRTEALESELAETKRKLDAEVEESRKGSLRREYEEGQSRTRIDDLVKSLGNVREELAVAKAQRDQLQARVEEMKIDLRAAEEKTAALQPRPTPRAAVTENGEQANGGGSEDLPTEQRLAIEMSDLKRDLELVRNELESARQQVEQYRSIAQSTEEDLARFTETSEQYREDTDRVLAEKNVRIKELEQRVEDLTSELATTSTGMSELRRQADEAARALDEQRAGFESELARLKDDAERYAEEKTMLHGDIKAQAEIAQQAQQSYEDELVKHAAAAQGLQAVRREYNELRMEVAGVRAEAEAAKGSLERGEESWAEQREGFERELAEAKRRREDVDAQNGVLHRQMESFSAELAALRQGRNNASPSGVVGIEVAAAGSPARDGNLQEVIRFLRREKEIVDVQYELSMQEAKRLQQQLDYASASLEATRQTLTDERRKAAEKTREEGSVTSLQQTINELNLHRESATTLRNEARVAREKLEEKVREIERLAAEIEPLQARVGELEGEVEAKVGELGLLQRDRDHWRERTQNIISKYDRVDLAEVEEMKQQLEAMKAQVEEAGKGRDGIEAEQATLRAAVAGHEVVLEEQRVDWTAKLERFKEQAKERNRAQNDQKRDLIADRDRLARELDGVKAELETIRGTVVALEESSAEAERKLAAAEKAKESWGEEGEVREDGDETVDWKAQVEAADGKAREQTARADELAGQVTALHARVTELDGQITDLQDQVERAKQVENSAGATHSAVDNEALEKLRQDLATAQRDVETLRAADATTQHAPITVTTTAPPTANEEAAQQIQAAVDQLRAEMESQHALALSQKDEESSRKMENLKQNLKRQLSEGRERQRTEAREELIAVHAAEVQKLKEEHESAVREMSELHEKELERLKADGGRAVEKAVGGEGGVKAEEGGAGVEMTDKQIVELIQSNERAKIIVRNNITKGVIAQTEGLKTTIREKEEEIGRLKEELERAHGANSATATTGNDEKLAALQAQLDEALKAKDDLQTKLDEAIKAQEELRTKLDAAQKDKEAAVAKAIDMGERKSKVQISMRDKYMAQINAVKKAAAETPEKGVKEVWGVAQKAMPAPAAAKAVPAASVPAPVSSGGPAAQSGNEQQEPPTADIPPSPSSSVPASTQVPATTASATPATQPQQTPEQIEAAKLRARQERFGAAPSAPSAAATSSAPAFSQSSSPPAFGSTNPFGKSNFGATPATFSGIPGSTFGQPSQPAAFAQPPGRPGSQQGRPGSPNPLAPSFAPGGPTRGNFGTGPAALRGLSSSAIPRSGAGGIPRGGGSGGGRGGNNNNSGGISIQGAAAAAQQDQGVATSQRGGLQSGLPRGPGNVGRGGGRGGGGRGAGNVGGQKRPFDGDGGAGDGKRTRGGAGSGSGGAAEP